MKLYIAYGSNLNIRQMKMRCPAAKLIGTDELKNYRLVFRGRRDGNGVANIEPAEGESVPIGIWKITKKDEEALDRYEGYPFLYEKTEIETEKGKAMVYIMTEGHPIAEPNSYYLEVISEGYKDCGLPTAKLEEFINETVR